MKWSYGITTVSERFQTTLPRTLQSLAAAGFSEPHLFVDGVCLPDNEIQDQYWISSRVPRIGLSANWYLSIVELYLREPNADRFALFQDDLVAVRNLRLYLEVCSYPANGYLNLFTFLENEIKTSRTCPVGWIEGVELANFKGQVYHGKRQQRGIGALALVFSKEALTTPFLQSHFVTRPQSGESAKTKIDGGIVESMNRAGYREYIHNPSLVSHTGHKSTKPGARWKKNANTFPGEQFDALTLLSRT